MPVYLVLWALCGASEADIRLPRFFMEKNPSANIYLINLPIDELPLSETFKLRSKLMEFFTLQDIIALDQAKLFEREGYSEKWYFEFIDFLRRKEILFLLTGS